MPADYSRIHRLLKIITLIQSGGTWNAARLAAETGATERSIYRDLKALDAAGVPVVFDDELKSYVIGRDFFLPPVQIRPEEALALIAMAEQVGGTEQVPHLTPAVQAAQKLRSQLPVGIRNHLEKSDGKVSIRLAAASSPESTQDIFARVHAAIENRQQMLVAYESLRASRSGEPTDHKFKFDPYALMFNLRSWYVIGHSHKHREVRSFKLSRFVRTELTNVTFELPKGWSLDKHLGNAWRMIRGKPRVEVELIFDAEFADTIDETRWHKTQQTDTNPDGSLTFTATVDGLDEIVWWVLSMGPYCRVVRPTELADRVRELARRTAAVYGPLEAPAAPTVSRSLALPAGA